MKQSGYAEHCHLRAEAPPAGSRQELVWPVGPPPQQVSAPNLWGTATGTVSCPRSIQCALPPLAPPRTRSPSVSEVSAPWTWRFKESSGTSMYPPPSPGAVGSTLPEDDAEASEPATKGALIKRGAGAAPPPRGTEPRQPRRSHTCACRPYRRSQVHRSHTHAHETRRHLPDTDHTHVHERHTDASQQQTSHTRMRVIQMLASNKDHTHARETDAHQQQRSHTRARERQTLARHTDHTRTPSVIQTCARHTDAHQQQTSHTHACHTDARRQQRSHTHARHTDARQPHTSHTRTCETYTHQPCGSHTHTRPHFSCLVPFPLGLPGDGAASSRTAKAQTHESAFLYTLVSWIKADRTI